MLDYVSKIPGAVKEDIESILNDIAKELQEGTFPLHSRIDGL